MASSLGIKYIGHFLGSFMRVQCCIWSLVWVDQLHILMDTWRIGDGYSFEASVEIPRDLHLDMNVSS